MQTLTPSVTEPQAKEAIFSPGDPTPSPGLSSFEARISPPTVSLDNPALRDYVARQRKRVKEYVHPSQNPRALMELGDIHAIRGEIHAAINCYKNAIALDSSLILGYKKIIPLLLNLRRVDEADRFFSRLVGATNQHVDYVQDYSLFQMSQFPTDLERIKRVRHHLQALVEHNPKHAALLNTYGIVLLMWFDDIDQARDQFLRVLKFDDHNIHANNNFGLCCLYRGNNDEAKSYFEKAISIDPNYVPGYENLAANELSLGHNDEALTILTKALANGIHLTVPWQHNLGWLLILRGDYQKAKPIYVELSRAEPSNNLVLNNLGYCEERTGDQDAAKKVYSAAVMAFREHQKSGVDEAYRKASLNAYYNLGRVLNGERDNNLTDQIGKEIIHLDGPNARGYYFRGAAAIREKKFVFAKAELEKAFDLKPDFVDPYIDLGFYYESIEHNYDKAVYVLQTADEKGLQHPLVANNLAYAYIKQGSLDKAQRILQTKLEHPALLATRGLFQMHKGNVKEGNDLYKKAIDTLKSERAKDEAKQAWHYELADYYRNQGMVQQAEDELRVAMGVNVQTYIEQDIKVLMAELKELSRDQPKLN